MTTNYSCKPVTSKRCRHGVADITSTLHAEGCQFNPGQHQTNVLKNKNSVFVCSKLYSKDFIQIKSTFENKFLPQIINLRVLWSRGYHVCFTLTRSPVQAWTASRKSLENKVWFWKIIFKWFHSSQQNLKKLLRSNSNLNVLLCSSYHVCLMHKSSPEQAWISSSKIFENKCSEFIWSKLHWYDYILINSTFENQLLL